MEMDLDYCLLCQESHQMTRYCLLSAKCKGCGLLGHLRFDCPAHRMQRQVNPCASSNEDPHEKRGMKRKSCTQISTRPLKSAKFSFQADDPSWDCDCSLAYMSTYQEPKSVKLNLPRVLQSQNSKFTTTLDCTKDAYWDNNTKNLDIGEPNENVICMSDDEDDNLINANYAFHEKFRKPIFQRKEIIKLISIYR